MPSAKLPSTGACGVIVGGNQPLKGRPSFLPQLQRSCSRDHEHQVLEGTTRVDGKIVNWTSVAAEYSRQWCARYAELQHAAVTANHGRSSACGG